MSKKAQDMNRHSIHKLTDGKKSKLSQIFMLVLGLVLIVLTISIILYFNKQSRVVHLLDNQHYSIFEKHYAFITEDFQNQFWDQVYESAKNQGKDLGIYVERFGENLAVDFSKEELMNMAIASKVDGILLEADQSEEIKELIKTATEQGIPVVTMMTDCYGSDRKSFIGLGSYNLGREYGRQIVRSANSNTKRVMILMDAETDTNNQTILFSGISETLSNEGNHLNLSLETKLIRDNGNFSAEEAIRDIFMEGIQLPDIIICLDENHTISTYQALIDYNLVGQVSLIGYYTSETILNAIDKNIVDATIAIDTTQIGMSAVLALDEYSRTGHVNDFVTLDVSTVTIRNVERYLEAYAETKE